MMPTLQGLKMLKKLALTALLVMFPLSAVAGSFSKEDEEFMRYTSYLGYTALVPNGWTRVDASVVEAAAGHIPLNIASKSIGQVDVIFYPKIAESTTTLDADNKRIETNKTAEKKLEPVTEESVDEASMYYVPTISVSMLKNYGDDISHLKNKTAYFKDEIQKHIEDKSSVPFSEPEVSSATYDEDLEMFIFKYKLKNKVDRERLLFNVEQYVRIDSSNKVFIVTCTKLDDENNLDPGLVVNHNWCKDFVKSIEYTD